MKFCKYLQHFEEKNSSKNWPFSIGDYIKIGFLFQEGEKKRLQFFEGMVIALDGPIFEKKVTLRRPGSFAIERLFSCQSPQIQKLQILQSQKFRRSKLFYLRKRLGKAAFGGVQKTNL